MMIEHMRLQDGEAQHVGDGVFIVFQDDELGVVNCVVMLPEDLKRMLGLD